MKTFHHTLHLPVFLFLLLELILFAYQLYHLIRLPVKKRRFWLMVLLTLVIGLNCADGMLISYFQLMIINGIFLSGAFIFFVHVRYWKLEVARRDLALTDELRLAAFKENCKKEGLTARETEIVLLVRQGFKNRHIGDRLFISEKTVDSHMQNIYGKTGERSKIALLYKLDH